MGASTLSALKFLVDMGLLMAFMFLVNMLAALILLPALHRCCWGTTTLPTPEAVLTDVTTPTILQPPLVK